MHRVMRSQAKLAGGRKNERKSKWEWHGEKYQNQLYVVLTYSYMADWMKPMHYGIVDRADVRKKQFIVAQRAGVKSQTAYCVDCK